VSLVEAAGKFVIATDNTAAAAEGAGDGYTCAKGFASAALGPCNL
jgi:hypothetical protein